MLEHRAELVLGPLLRYAGTESATFWVETSAPCRVEILGHDTSTFTVEGHHYALLLGDQVYADEVSPETLEFIEQRRGTDRPPGEQIADFEEYTRLYRESWSEPDIRWLLSTVPTAMIFDDHDVNDDWNISWSWVEEMRRAPWWEARVTGAFMAYWIYQHIGNLSPPELDAERTLDVVAGDDDAA